MKRLFTLFVILFCFAEVRGQIMWERIEKDTVTYRDQYTKIILKDSLIYLSGLSTWNNNGHNNKTFHTCYNINGKLKWRKNGRNIYYNYPDVILDSDSILLSYRYNSNWFKLDLLRIRTATGDTLPPRQFTVPYAMKSIPYGLLIKEPAGTYMIGAGGAGPHLAKLNTNGQPLWSKSQRWADPLGNFGFIDMHGFLRMPNGNYVMGATRWLPYNNSTILHPVLIELNANGDTVKSKNIIVTQFNYNERAWYSNLIRTRKGDFVFTGELDSVNNGFATKRSYFLTKVDQQFNIKWTYHNRGALNEYHMRFVYELADSSFAVLAGKRTGLTGDYAIIKISKTGQYISHTTYTSPFCNGLPMIFDWKLLPDGTSIVAGKCKNHGYTYLARLASVGAPAVLGNAKEEINSTAVLETAFPNPANETVTFVYNLPAKTKSAEVLIREIGTGKLVKTVNVNATRKQQQLAISELSSGMYAYTLLVDGVPVSTKKLAIVK